MQKFGYPYYMHIYVAGIGGLVGSALAREARYRENHVSGKRASELDFLNRGEVMAEFGRLDIDVLFIAAAKVGGIGANNSFPVDFLSINLQIQNNLLDAAHQQKIPKVVFLGSSCIYPKHSKQPIMETALLTGPLEPTNEPYAIAKIAGLKLVESYRRQYGHHWISVMPTNMYGPFDNFDIRSAHVLPAIIKKMHNAKISNAGSVEIWGDGTPLREFMHVDDFARACFDLIDVYDESNPINVGTGEEVTIKELCQIIASVVGYDGELKFTHSELNGVPRKILNSERIRDLGWRPEIKLNEGIRSTYEWFKANEMRGGEI